jgi:AcrR family transcriptional regulator
VAKVTQAHIEARTTDIVEAAERTFAQKGFARATMQEIATEAGLSAGAIYRYFPSKEAIVHAMSEESVKRREALVAQIRAEGGDTFEILGKLADVFFGKLRDPECRGSCSLEMELFAEAARNEQVREAMNRGFNSLLAPFIDIVREGQRRGDIAPDVDAESVGRIMIALHDGLAIQLSAGQDVDVEAYVYAMKCKLSGMFWTGAKPPKEERHV